MYICNCDGYSMVYEYLDYRSFHEWMNSLNYRVLHAFFLLKETHVEYIHDAYDVHGNIIGTYHSPVKLTEREARKLYYDSGVEYEEVTDEEVAEFVQAYRKEKKIFFDSLEDARPGDFPSTDKIERYLHGERMKADYWLRYIGTRYWEPCVPCYYVRELKDIENFDSKSGESALTRLKGARI